MADQPPASLAIDVAEFTLAEAYAFLKIEDTEIPDGDVVVAFRACTASRKHKALEIIARRRQSQWLAFVLTILPHLTAANVALLATPPRLADVPASPGNVKTEESSGQTGLGIVNDPHSDTQHPDTSHTAAGETSDGDVSMTAASSDDDDDISILPEDSNSASSERTMSSGIPLSEEDSADSDFDEPIGGRYWDGHDWRCEECNDELVNGRCPNGDVINPCKNCARDFQSGVCSEYCDNCHAGLGERCDACGDQSLEDTNAEAKMIWDDLDGVWRCTVCLWEVEANSEEEGHCHCRVGSKSSRQRHVLADYGLRADYQGNPDYTKYGRARRIDLLYYHEYEPADSDSSGPESIDSEPDSDDEAFVEDDGPFDPALLTLEPPLCLPNPPEDPDESVAMGADDGPESMDTA